MSNPTADPQSVRSVLRGFVVENFLFGRDNGFSDDDSFIGMGLLDSTGVLELATFVERTFGLSIEDHELTPENLDSIAALAAYVGSKRSV